MVVTLSAAEHAFILALARLEPGVEFALQDLNHALQHNDVKAGVRAARRFSSIGVLLDEAQKGVAG